MALGRFRGCFNNAVEVSFVGLLGRENTNSHALFKKRCNSAFRQVCRSWLESLPRKPIRSFNCLLETRHIDVASVSKKHMKQR